MSRHRSRSSSGERRSHRSKHHSTISKKHSKKHHKHKHKKKSSREKMRSPSRQSSSVEISIPAAHLKRLGLDYDDLSLREGAGTVSPGRSTAGALFSPVEGVVCDSTTADRQPAVLGPAADTGSVEEQQTASSPPPQQAVAGSVLAGTPRDIASPEPAGRSRSNSPCHALRELSKSPRKCSRSGRKRSRSPRKRSRSPREDSRSSRKHSRSSRKRSRLPRERSRSPRERSRSPRERSRSPRKRSRSPRKQSKLSRKRSRSPRERSRSPKKRSKSSRKRSRSPWRRHRTQRSPLGRRSRHRRHGYSRSPSVDSSSGHSRSPHRRSASRRRHQRRSLSSVSFSASPRHGSPARRPRHGSPARRPRHRRYSRSPSHSGHGRRAYLTTPTVPASTLLKLVPVDPKAESIQAYTKLCTEMSSRRLVQAPPPSGPGGGGGGGRDGYSFREPFAASSAQQKPTANLVLHSNTWKTPAQAVLDRASPAGGGAAVRLFPVSDGKDHSTAGPDGSQDPQGAVVSAGQGVYRGVATLQSLPWGEHSRGFQAWTKKNMFLNLRPVRGGFGEAMLRKMGWKEGTPLGISGEGSVEPIMDLVKLDRKCLTTAGDPPLMRGGHHITMVPAGTTLPGPAPSPAHNMCSKGVYSGKHPVSVLQEFASKKRWDVQYDLVDCKGPSHQRNFKYKVTTPTGVFIPEDGSASKKAAKAQAALVCLVKIGLNVA